MEESSILASLKVPANYNVEEVVEREFGRLKGQCYLDHAGASLYSEGQVQEVARELSRALLGNPHSRHNHSDSSTQSIEAMRHRILEHFNTTEEEYDLIFTSSATDALKLIGECFEWSPGHHTPPWDPVEGEDTELRDKKEEEEEEEEPPAGAYVYVQENHTSILGIRGPAHEAGCDIFCVTTKEAIDLLKEDSKGVSVSDANGHFVTGCEGVKGDPEDATKTNKESIHASKGLAATFHDPTSDSKVPSVNSSLTKDSTPTQTCLQTPQNELQQAKRRNCLFAYSAQCNFSGSKYPLEWIKKVQDGALNGLLSTSPINRRKTPSRSSSTSRGCPDDPAWYVLLDAAGLVSTCPLDLTLWKPDFVPVSFYKIFGYPTGLGCLLVAWRAWGLLRRAYQGGGTVLMKDSRRMVTVPRPTLHERFEDGTPAFLAIPALRHGLDTIHRLTGGMDNISTHVYHLARYTHHALRSMRHARGTPVAHLHVAPGDTWLPSTHGSIVNFNLKNPDGSFVGYAQVERVASLYNIQLRTGCVCNPGACQAYLGITTNKLLTQFKAGHVCGDAIDLVDGRPTGAVRVSFGYCSTYRDADLLLKMVLECFVEQPVTFDLTWMKGEVDLGWLQEGKEGGMEGGAKEKKDVINKGVSQMKEIKGEINDVINNNSNSTEQNPITVTPSTPSHPPAPPSTHRLTDIVVYPIKSCGGVKVGMWGLGGAGLWLDRRWMVVTGAGATLTQKRLPRMALVLPRFDLESREMVLSFAGEEEEVRIPLDPEEPLNTSEAALCVGRVCGVRVQGLDCGATAGDWLSRVLGLPDLRLMMQTSHRLGKLGKGSGVSGESLSLANESQYLVIHRPSVRSLLKEITSRGLEELTEDELVERFRGNLVVDGGAAYEEDSWNTLTICGTTLQVQGGCRRCQMVCVVPESGQRTREPMLSLASARGTSMLFGVHASAPPVSEGEKRKLCVGAAVEVARK